MQNGCNIMIINQKLVKYVIYMISNAKQKEKKVCDICTSFTVNFLKTLPAYYNSQFHEQN